MIAFKKIYSDELLRLALVLSLLKANPSDILEQETLLTAGLHSSNGSDWSIENEARTFIRPTFIHPKSLDNILLNYESEIFEELNSLGRYSRNYAYSLENNDRMSNVNRGPVVHTYVLNNLATDTANPALSEPVASPPEVQYEVKIETEDGDPETEDVVKEEEIETTPDLVVTLSEDFFSNRSETDVFDEIVSRSFDVSEFLVAPDAMHIKIEPEQEIDVTIKKEDDGDLYSDNANDEFVPYFAAKKEDCDKSEDNSVFDQNMSDLQDYGNVKDFPKFDNDFEYVDVKKNPEDLEQYLLENTSLDAEVYELAPVFEDELVVDSVVKKERASTSFTSSASSSGVSEMDIGAEETAIDSSDLKSESDEGHHTSDELTQEDMDLIEVLWKQDVDMGFCLDNPQMGGPHATKVELGNDLDAELKLVEEKLQKEKLEQESIEKVKAALLDEPDAPKQADPWAGLSYVVDTETGEYVLQGDLPGDLVNGEDTRFDLLEEALQLVELRDEDPAKNEKDKPPSVESEVRSSEDQPSTMLHPAMARHAIPHHHPLAHYHNQNLMRSMSVEQRWQDLASLLTLPPPHDQYPYAHHQQHPHNIGGHAPPSGYPANYGPIGPVAEKHSEPYHGPPAPIDNGYKIDHGHPHPHPQHNDSGYYQNGGGPEMGNSDGFLQSILNDEDMQLMDMAMNEGMYTMRMLDGAVAGAPPPHHQPSHLAHSHMMIAERDSASDSAVSSMGSERVPSLSDGEWCDAGSDSAQEYHSSKFRPYDASFARDRAHTGNQPPQKKHHMFGKRCFQEQQQPIIEPLLPEPQRPTAVVKYEYPEHPHHQYQQDNAMAMSNEFASHRPQVVSHHPHLSTLQPAIDINSPHSSHALLHSNMSPSARYVPGATLDRVRHNHTYSAPLMNLDTRPGCARDKRARRLTDGGMSDTGSSNGGHLSRDEKRAKALGKSSIPLEVQDIINLPMDEFNERLSKHDLSEAQLSLIRDIRRRGKNKVAAQNCRKRKLDQITSLADELQTVRDRKIRTQRDYQSLQAERQRVKERFAALYRHVFQNLRDPEGRPLSSAQYSLQQAADGNVVLVPKMPQQGDHPMNRTEDDIDRKTKNFDQ